MTLDSDSTSDLEINILETYSSFFGKLCFYCNKIFEIGFKFSNEDKYCRKLCSKSVTENSINRIGSELINIDV